MMNRRRSVESPSSHIRTPIWLDCDTGHDDAFAILLAARHPNVRLLGVSTIYGNAPLGCTTQNSCAILAALGCESVPVYPGADRPFYRAPLYAPEIHGQSGLDGTTCLPGPQVPPQTDLPAVDAMNMALMSQPRGTAWLVATGALTNVASLFARHIGLVDHLAGLSIMGGAVGGGFTDAPLGKVEGEGERFGNYTRTAEFNIYCDPEAAHMLFSNPRLAAKTTLVTLDLTHKFLATSEIQYGMLFGFGRGRGAEPTMAGVPTIRRLFFEILTYFKKTYAEVFGLTVGAPTHDPLAVAAAFAPYLFYCNMLGHGDGDQSERFTVTVVTDGAHGSSQGIRDGSSQCGRTIVSAAQPGEPGVRIPRGLEVRELWGMLERCLRLTEDALAQAAKKEPTSQSVLNARAASSGSPVVGRTDDAPISAIYNSKDYLNIMSDSMPNPQVHPNSPTSMLEANMPDAPNVSYQAREIASDDATDHSIPPLDVSYASEMNASMITRREE